MSATALLALIPTLASTIRNGVAVFADLKEDINRLFQAGEITAEQQKALMDEVDDILEMFAGEELPDHWKLQPDPQS